MAALEAGEIDIAILFSTSGIIADKGWVLLEDDQQMLAADNVVPVVTTELQEAYGEQLTDVLDDISAALTTEDLTEMNRRFDIDTEDAETSPPTGWPTTASDRSNLRRNCSARAWCPGRAAFVSPPFDTVTEGGRGGRRHR